MSVIKSIQGAVALGAAAGIALMFFMPWVIVDAELASPVGAVGRKFDSVTGTTVGSKVTNMFRGAVTAVTGRTKVAHMSGWQIARSDRNEFMQFVGEVTVFFGGKAKDPRQVRFLFLIPVTGVLLGLLIVQFGGTVWGRVLGGVAALIGLFMGFKLLTSPLGNEVAQAHLQWGIWGTVVIFLILGAAGFLKK